MPRKTTKEEPKTIDTSSIYQAASDATTSMLQKMEAAYKDEIARLNRRITSLKGAITTLKKKVNS